MIRALYVTDGQSQAGLSRQEIADALAVRKGLLWVDIPDLDDDGIDLLRHLFRFHELAIEDCANQRIESPKVDDYGDYLFIVAHSIAYTEGNPLPDITECDIFLGRHYVVTTRRRELSPVDALFERATHNGHACGPGADFLTHNVLDVMVDQLLPAVEAMDERLDGLEERILDRPERDELLNVLELKRATQRLRRSILPQRDLVNRLSRGEFDLISREALIFYRDVYDHIVRVEEMLDGLRDLADSALSSYLSAVNNRMNEIMKAMFVVAVIFLPLTLIASIYGMNFNFMPELQWEYGYLFALGLMAMTVAAPFWFFHRKGWLR